MDHPVLLELMNMRYLEALFVLEVMNVGVCDLGGNERLLLTFTTSRILDIIDFGGFDLGGHERSLYPCFFVGYRRWRLDFGGCGLGGYECSPHASGARRAG